MGIPVISEGSESMVAIPLVTEIGYLYCGREHELFRLEDAATGDEQVSGPHRSRIDAISLSSTSVAGATPTARASPRSVMSRAE